MSRILVVEDEQHLADGLRYNLEAEQYDVDLVDNGEDALERLSALPSRYDLVILDVMLPGVDGFGAGADDYLPKPFELPILLSRVRGLLRRHEWFRLGAAAQAAPVASQFSFRDRSIDFEQLEVRVGDKRMPLTLMEAALLRYLVQHEGQSVPRKVILEKVWSVHEDTDTRAIDNFIVRLRRYLEEDPSRPKHLVTVRGIGYRFLTGEENAP